VLGILQGSKVSQLGKPNELLFNRIFSIDVKASLKSYWFFFFVVLKDEQITYCEISTNLSNSLLLSGSCFKSLHFLFLALV